MKRPNEPAARHLDSPLVGQRPSQTLRRRQERLRRSLAETIASHQTTNGLQILPVQLAHALALEKLPLHHKDPFDRLLIAQANHENWEIVTADPEFKAYPVRVIW